MRRHSAKSRSTRSVRARSPLCRIRIALGSDVKLSSDEGDDDDEDEAAAADAEDGDEAAAEDEGLIMSLSIVRCKWSRYLAY